MVVWERTSNQPQWFFTIFWCISEFCSNNSTAAATAISSLRYFHQNIYWAQKSRRAVQIPKRKCWRVIYLQTRSKILETPATLLWLLYQSNDLSLKHRPRIILHWSSVLLVEWLLTVEVSSDIMLRGQLLRYLVYSLTYTQVLWCRKEVSRPVARVSSYRISTSRYQGVSAHRDGEYRGIGCRSVSVTLKIVDSHPRRQAVRHALADLNYHWQNLVWFIALENSNAKGKWQIYPLTTWKVENMRGSLTQPHDLCTSFGRCASACNTALPFSQRWCTLVHILLLPVRRVIRQRHGEQWWVKTRLKTPCSSQDWLQKVGRRRHSQALVLFRLGFWWVCDCIFWQHIRQGSCI